jgi:hypothetical protein
VSQYSLERRAFSHSAPWRTSLVGWEALKISPIAHEAMPPGLSAIFRSHRQLSGRPTIVPHPARFMPPRITWAGPPDQENNQWEPTPLVPGHYPGFQNHSRLTRVGCRFTRRPRPEAQLSLLRELRRRACPALKYREESQTGSSFCAYVSQTSRLWDSCAYPSPPPVSDSDFLK